MQPQHPQNPGASLPPVPTPAAPPSEPQTAAGWYGDPWGMTQWRWWDGQMWTHHSSGDAKSKPKLWGWLSWPIIVGLIFALPIIAITAIQTPIAIPLAFIPMVFVGPVLLWLDRIEPEPFQDRLHAFLWGWTISGVVAGIINSIVAATSSETWAAVASAPISEEIMKALGIVWALRRKEIDGVMDGVVYAGWVALGFAVVENFLYFSGAAQEGVLVQTVIARGFITPFAHPLFTVWSGLAIGWAVSKNRPVLPLLAGGLAVAIATHAAWNGSLTLAEDNGVVLLVAIPAFILLFGASGFALVRIRKGEQAAFLARVPMLAQRYGLSAQEVAIFGNWRTTLDARKQLTKANKKNFDEVHGTLARLAALHARPAPLDTAAESVLVGRLHTARAGSA